MTVFRATPEDVVKVLGATRAGDKVELAPGEYTMQLTIDKPVVMQGRGAGTWFGNVASPVIRVTCSGVELHDLDLEARTDDEVALWYGADAPRLVGVRALKGKVLAAGITFAPVPVILLREAPERRRMTTAPIATVAPPPVSQPPPSKPPAPPPAPPAPPPRARTSPPPPPPPAPAPAPVTATSPATMAWRPPPNPTDWRIVAGIGAGIAVLGFAAYLSQSGGKKQEGFEPETKLDDKGTAAPQPEAAPAPALPEPCPPDYIRNYVDGKPDEYGDRKAYDKAYWQRALAAGRAEAQRMPGCIHVTSAVANFLYRVNYDVCATADNREAMQLINHARLEAPNDAAMMRNRGRIFASQHQFADALAEFNAAAAVGAPEKSQEWIYSLRSVLANRTEMVQAARGVVEGRYLSPDELAVLDLADLAVVESGLIAKVGKSSELSATDWFYFCPDSPLGEFWRPTFDPDFTGSASKLWSDVDKYNRKLIDARQEQAKLEEGL